MILSLEVIAGLTPDEHEAAWGEIRRWLRAGAVPDTEPPPLVRPAGHVWTWAEIDALDVDEFDANEQGIIAQATGGPVG